MPKDARSGSLLSLVPGIHRPPGAVSSCFAQKIVQIAIRVVIEPSLAPAGSSLKFNFSVHVFALITRLVAPEQSQHFISLPGSVPNLASEEKIPASNPIAVKLWFFQNFLNLIR